MEKEEERVESAPARARSLVRSAVRDAWDCVVVVRCRVIRGPLPLPSPQGSLHVGCPSIFIIIGAPHFRFCFVT